jgi:hypothetical protein
VSYALAGVALLVAAYALGTRVVGVRARPLAPKPVYIAFQSPVPETLNHGVEISTQIGFSNCRSPVLVQVTVIPSAEYWTAERGRVPKSAHFSIAIGDPMITGAQFTSAWVENAARAPDSGQLTAGQIVRTNDAVIARGTMRNWAADEAGVSITFLANWLSYRGGTSILDGESCYLSLPALTGIDAAGFAGDLYGDDQRLNSRSHVFTLHRHGTLLTAVDATNASVARNLVYPSGNTDSDLSTPKPTSDAPLGTAWQCSDHASKLQVNPLDPKQYEPSVAAFAANNSLSALANSGSRSNDCSALVVVNDGAYQTVHDLTLALIGVLLGFGAQFIFAAGRSAAKA